MALVTGAARRLGRHIARALARAGADVAIHYHSAEDGAAQTQRELQLLGVRAEIFQADLANTGEITDLFVRLHESFGGLDILINSAALFNRVPVLEITPAEWDRVLNLNLRAAFFCSQEAVRSMKRRGAGSIINIADIAAFQPWPAYAHHSISKAGLVMLTRVLARALAPEIRVNAIAPGPVLPPDDLSEAQRAELAELTALNRLGAPEDVTSAVLFLIGAGYVTGETLVVDGGKLLRG
ncbi:MAG: SDR family oxidoreductase [Gemmatimonadota bacterium]|nr:MAG: SDR family oxidoreductase [Gemmatimonadota bacterium]